MLKTPEHDGPRELIARAMDAARAHGFDCVAPEHVLIACVEGPSARLQDLLDRLRIRPASLRDTILARARHGSDTVPLGQLPVTISVKRVLEASLKEAESLDERRIDVAHVVLGLLGDDGIAGATLRDAGLRIDIARMHLARTREQDEDSEDDTTHA